MSSVGKQSEDNSQAKCLLAIEGPPGSVLLKLVSTHKTEEKKKEQCVAAVAILIANNL